jgi:hypothetical protein
MSEGKWKRRDKNGLPAPIAIPCAGQAVSLKSFLLLNGFRGRTV